MTVAADFNQDGRAEIVVLRDFRGKAGNEFWVVRLNEDGQWENLPNGVCDTTVNFPANFAVAGVFDQRGRPELVVAVQGSSETESNDFWVMRMRTDGRTWERASFIDCSGDEIAARFAVVGDFDGDRYQEIAIAKQNINGHGDEFWVAEKGEGGDWGFLPEIKCGDGSVPVSSAVAGDFDGDGADELVILSAMRGGSRQIWIADWTTNGWNITKPTELASVGSMAVSGKFDPQEDSPPDQLVVQVPQLYNYFWGFKFEKFFIPGWDVPCQVAEFKLDYDAPFPVLSGPPWPNLSDLNMKARMAIDTGMVTSRSNLTYLEEMLYFVPLEAALRLRDGGQYLAALDWFRRVYSYAWGGSISFKLDEDQQERDGKVVRSPDWLLDPLNPHAIAEMRRNSYTRYTILAIVRCLLDYADAEFTRFTAESVPRARELYREALELLNLDQVRQNAGRCAGKIADLTLNFGDEGDYLVLLDEIRERLAGIHNYHLLTETVEAVNAVFNRDQPLRERLAEAYQLVAELPLETPTVATSLQEDAAGRRRQQTALLADTTVRLTAARRGAAGAGLNISILDGTTGPVIYDGNGRPPDIFDRFPGFREVEGAGSDEVIPVPSISFCVPPNPVIASLRSHAELNLYKIRTCRNIAGMETTLEPYEMPTAQEASLQSLNADRLPGFSAPSLLPLPYRYGTLVARSRDLIDLARQMESAMLSAIQSRDRVEYEVMKARQDLALARASVRLKDLQLAEANNGITLAELQRGRSEIQSNEYNRLLRQDITLLEYASLAFLASAAITEAAVAISYSAAAVQTGWSAEGVVSWWGKSSGLAAQALSASAANMHTTASITTTLASYERRRQEWRFQQTLAAQDIRIGQQQVQLAHDRVRIVAQERAITNLQVDQAETMVDFLDNKQFGTYALYDWMSNVLEQVYRYFLQQATAMARLAEQQLAFERQALPEAHIQADYWEPPMRPATRITESGDVRGLTGAERLLRDLTDLDQYAFRTNQRKLQLTETISLAQQDPFAFQKFREIGILTFETPMDLFDHKFPGHYLRLIRRVRTSVIALIPPTQGIRATLSSLGTSRVVIKGDTFQTVGIQRGPESISLTSPMNATGLFELDAQSAEAQLLLPFEGIGVDTRWELRLPKAANLFDYDTIADVLFTIEYTALEDFAYRSQMIKRLNGDRIFTADRAFSFRNELADQWYDLHNPELIDEKDQLIVTFETIDLDFPPNIEDPKIEQVVLYFVSKDRELKPIEKINLKFTYEQKDPATGVITPVPVEGGDAKPVNGKVSTRVGHWMSLMGGQLPVAGTWTLSFRPDEADPNKQTKLQQIANLFKAETKHRPKQQIVGDILFVITYSGQTPKWPE